VLSPLKDEVPLDVHAEFDAARPVIVPKILR